MKLFNRITISAILAAVSLQAGIVTAQPVISEPMDAVADAESTVRNDFPDTGNSSAQYTVRLITGDTVMVFAGPGSEKSYAVVPTDDRNDFSYRTIEKNVPGTGGEEKNTYIIPDDVDLTRFDMELFNIDYLVEEKYYELLDIPVLIVTDTGPDLYTVNAYQDTIYSLASSVEVFDELPVAAATFSYETVTLVYEELSTQPTIEKVWLDRKVRVNLASSVPQIGAPEIWDDYGCTGNGIIISILDTGIDDTHPDLDDLDDNALTTDPKVLDHVNFSTDNTTADLHGHGTHCAGIAAGSGNISQGVAPGAWLYNVKVLNEKGSGFDSKIIEGIEYAVLGPDGVPDTGDETDIISMSLGSSPNSGDDPLSLAVDWATEQGVVVVVAAGNEGSNYFTAISPGTSRGAITVGAVSKTDVIASFSSRGPTMDFRIKPDVVAPGVSIIAPRASGTSMGSAVSDYLTSASGTSMATPHVAGAAALILESSPEIPAGWQLPQYIKTVFMNSAVDLGYNTYTQGTGRIYLPNCINPPVLVEPATTSFTVDTENPAGNRTLTFYNMDSVAHTLTLSSTLSEATTAIDCSEYSALNTTSLVVPAGDSATVTLSIDATALPHGLYSGVVKATLDTGETVRAVFGFTYAGKIIVTKIDKNGNPAADHLVLSFDDAEDPWYGSGFTDESGLVIITAPDGTYQVYSHSSETLGGDTTIWTFGEVTIPAFGDANITLDERDTVPVDFDPNKPDQVIAEKSSHLSFIGEYHEGYQSAYHRYPSNTTTWITPGSDWLAGFLYSYYPEEYYDPKVIDSPEWAELRYDLGYITGPVHLVADYDELVTRTTTYRTWGEDIVCTMGMLSKDAVNNYYGSGSWKVKLPVQRTETLSPSPISYCGSFYYDENGQRISIEQANCFPYTSGEETAYSYGGHPLNSGVTLNLSGGRLYVSGTVFSDSEGNGFYNHSRSPAGHITITQNGQTTTNSTLDIDFLTYMNLSYVLPGTGETIVTIDSSSGLDISAVTQTILTFTADPYLDWRPPEYTLNIDPSYLSLYNEVMPGVLPVTITATDSGTGVASVSLEYSADNGSTWVPAALLPEAADTWASILDIPEADFVSFRVTVTDNAGNSRTQTVLSGVYINTHLLPGDVNGDGSVNVLDVTRLVRIILELDPGVSEADVNQDGSVNVLDITQTVSIILGKN
ncbi:MAG: S8 family serine peptidase [Dehalococcoidales bacterium]|nr:S8 family serine peptidase [Dehalococcoidales bacterium]